MFELERNRSSEKSRNLKVLDLMQRKREQELGGKVNGNLSGAQSKAPTVMRRKAKKQTGKKN